MSTASKKVVMALAALSVMFFQDAVTSAEEEELEDSSELDDELSELEDCSSEEDEDSSEDDDSSELEISSAADEDSDDTSEALLEEDSVVVLVDALSWEEALEEDEFVEFAQEARKAAARARATKFFCFMVFS